jgi:hypothetical protein
MPSPTRLVITCAVIGQLLGLVTVSLFLGFCPPGDVLCRDLSESSLMKHIMVPRARQYHNGFKLYPRLRAQVSRHDFQGYSLEKASSILELVPNDFASKVCRNPTTPEAQSYSLWICALSSSPQHSNLDPEQDIIVRRGDTLILYFDLRDDLHVFLQNNNHQSITARIAPLQLHFSLEHYAAIFSPLLFPLLLPFFVRLVKDYKLDHHKEIHSQIKL